MPASKRGSAARSAGRRSAQDAKQALYRSLVLDAAEGLFADRGVEASKMEEIAEAAGLSLGTVYSVFRGKAAILDSLHETRLRELVQMAAVVARGLPGPVERLVAGVRAYVEYFVSHPDYLRIHLSEGRSWGMPVTGRSPRADAWEEGHAMQVRVFERGIDAGIFYADDPDRLANTVAAMAQVRLADWAADGMKGSPEALIAGMELQLRRAFCVRPEDRGDEPPAKRARSRRATQKKK